MTSQTSEQTIAIHISPNISRSKGNHTVRLDFATIIFFHIVYFQLLLKVTKSLKTCSALKVTLTI